jgi:MATE family multidrug resistance protein
MFMQVVDTLFVGRLGAHALGCVSIGNALYFTLMLVGMGSIMGLDFMASHAFGAKRFKDCHESLIQALYLATFVSFLFSGIMIFFAYHLHWFGIDPDLVEGTKHYAIITALSLWPFLLFSGFRQYLQAMGVAMPILMVLVASNIVNAVGNYIFVWGNWGSPSYGVIGSAWSTVFARCFMCAAAGGYVFWRDRKMKLGLAQSSFGFSPQRTWALLKLGLPASGHLLLEVGVFSCVTMLTGRLGASVISAHQIVLHIASTAFMVPLGLSMASAVRIGQALGAKQYPRASQIGWIALLIAALWMSFSACMILLFSHSLLSAFTQDNEVLRIGMQLMLVAALFQISDGLQVSATGVLRGIADTRSPMFANLIGHWCLGLPIGAFLCFKLGWGVRGLWMGLCIGLSFVALSLVTVWKIKSKKIGQENGLKFVAKDIVANVLP